MSFDNIKDYEFSPMIDAKIGSKYDRWEITIEQLHDVKNNKVFNDITIECETFGYEGTNSRVSFSLEDMEDLIAKFKNNKNLIKVDENKD